MFAGAELGLHIVDRRTQTSLVEVVILDVSRTTGLRATRKMQMIAPVIFVGPDKKRFLGAQTEVPGQEDQARDDRVDGPRLLDLRVDVNAVARPGLVALGGARSNILLLRRTSPMKVLSDGTSMPCMRQNQVRTEKSCTWVSKPWRILPPPTSSLQYSRIVGISPGLNCAGVLSPRLRAFMARKVLNISCLRTVNVRSEQRRSKSLAPTWPNRRKNIWRSLSLGESHCSKETRPRRSVSEALRARPLRRSRSAAGVSRGSPG